MEWSFQWRTSRRIGRVSADRTNRWRWSPEWFSVHSRWLDFSSLRRSSYSTLCAEERNIPYSTEVYWRNEVHAHQSGRHARSALTIIGRSMRTEVCQIRELVSQNLLYWYMWSGRDWQKFKRLRDWITCGRKCGQISANHRKNEKKKQEWANEKPKLENARRIRGNYLIDPEDKEETFCKMRGESWKCTWKRPCRARRKIQTNFASRKLDPNQQSSKAKVRLCNGASRIHETASGTDSSKRSWRPHRSKRWKILLTIIIWYTNSLPCRTRWKFRMQKASSRRRMEKSSRRSMEAG